MAELNRNTQTAEPYKDIMAFYRNIDARVVLCGHGHELHRKQFNDGLPVDGLVQSMCKSARLTAPDSLRGFNVLVFERKNGVAQSVQVIPYEFRSGEPVQTVKNPEKWILGLTGVKA